MHIDTEVNHIKFDRELGRLNDQRMVLESRGLFVLGSTAHPFIDMLYVPRNPLRCGPVTPPPGTPTPPIPPGLPKGTTPIMLAEVLSLAGRGFKARFDLTDYDMRAPSLEFLDPWTDIPLAYKTMFRALEFEEQRRTHLVLLDDHPITHKPFLCLRGIREYHEHPQHSGDDWMLYRKTMSIFSFAMSVWRVTIDLIRPQLIIQPNGVQVQFVAEEKA